MKKERLVAAPHTFMLSVLLMISIPAAYAIMLISHQESIGAFLRVPGALQVTLLVAVIYLALLVTLFCTRYQWAAVAEICEDRIVFWALFTHRTFYYGDMHHIGIDYGLLDGRKQFWMYFSKTPIPAMYYHRQGVLCVCSIAKRLMKGWWQIRRRKSAISFESVIRRYGCTIWIRKSNTVFAAGR